MLQYKSKIRLLKVYTMDGAVKTVQVSWYFATTVVYSFLLRELKKEITLARLMTVKQWVIFCSQCARKWVRTELNELE